MVRINCLQAAVPAVVLVLFLAAAPAAACPGDCDADGEVTVDEIIAGVGIALGELPPERCPAIDLDGDAHVMVDELLTSVAALLQGCPPQQVVELHIDAPAHGTFTTADRIELRGRVGSLPEGYALRLDGDAVRVGAQGDFNAEIALPTDVGFRPILAEVVDARGRLAARQRVVVIVGEALPATEFAAGGLEARITDSGLAQMSAGLTEGLPLDLESILAPGTVLVSRYCALDSVLGCLQRVDVTARSASVREVAVALDSTPGALVADISMEGVRVVVNIRGGAINCDVAATASQALVTGLFDLEPAADDPQRIAVRQLGDADVRFEQPPNTSLATGPKIGVHFSARRARGQRGSAGGVAPDRGGATLSAAGAGAPRNRASRNPRDGTAARRGERRRRLRRRPVPRALSQRDESDVPRHKVRAPHHVSGRTLWHPARAHRHV